MLIAALTAAATAQAQSPNPVAVNNAMAEIGKTCTDLGGRPDLTAVLKRADLTRDRLADFVLDANGAVCFGAAAAYGNSSRAVAVYVNDGNGVVSKRFDDEAYGAKVQASTNGNVLWLTVSGKRCGKTPTQSRLEARFCDRPLRWLVKTQNFVYAPVSAARPIN